MITSYKDSFKPLQIATNKLFTDKMSFLCHPANDIKNQSLLKFYSIDRYWSS